MNKYYFDTSTVIDCIDDSSPYHKNVTRAITQTQSPRVFSEYMENELKSVLRHAEKFIPKKDYMLEKYFNLKQTLNSIFVQNDSRVSNLHNLCKRRRIRPLKFQDMVHIGICGLENIINIISEDRHIFGRDRFGQPIIDTVRRLLQFSDPRHTFTTRSGFLRQEI